MYRIAKPSDFTLTKHADALIPYIKAEIESFLPSVGAKEILVADLTKLRIKVKVEPGGITEWFLNKIHNETYLRNLMVGDMDFLLSVIQEIEIERENRKVPVELMQQKMTQTLYHKLNPKFAKAKHKRKVTRYVDSFHDVLTAIFVDYGYEGYKDKKNKILVFDKVQHVSSLGLRICPYCGRSFIFHFTNGGKDVKPQLEHYLQKSLYPYLALSFYNLIPVCNICNVDCKGTENPLIHTHKRPFRFIYPYEFRDDMLKFGYILKDGYYNRDSSFEVNINYGKNKELEAGSKDVMKLDAFYACHNHEAANIYRQLLLLKSHAQDHYRDLGLTPSYTTITPKLVLGFRFDSKSSQNELLYKFKKDIYQAMTEKLLKP